MRRAAWSSGGWIVGLAAGMVLAGCSGRAEKLVAGGTAAVVDAGASGSGGGTGGSVASGTGGGTGGTIASGSGGSTATGGGTGGTIASGTGGSHATDAGTNGSVAGTGGSTATGGGTGGSIATGTGGSTASGGGTGGSIATGTGGATTSGGGTGGSIATGTGGSTASGGGTGGSVAGTGGSTASGGGTGGSIATGTGGSTASGGGTGGSVAGTGGSASSGGTGGAVAGTGGSASSGGTGGAVAGTGGSGSGGGTGGSVVGPGGSASGGGTGGAVAGTGGSASGGGTGGSGGTISAGAPGFTAGPTGCGAQTLEANVSVGGYMSDRYGWSDSACLRRTAALVRNNASDPGGTSGGYLRQLTFSVNGAARTATGTGANGWNGWGYVVDHYASSVDNSRGKTGTFRTVLAGTHHAMHEYTVQMNPGGPVLATIHWFFADGRSEPVYAIRYDITAAANVVKSDTRAPYGDLAFEGTSGPIGGIGWGDLYKFTTTGAGPVTLGSAWDYTQPNVVPYVRMWSSNVDAEMGAVQTQTFAQHIAGGDYGGGAIADCQGHTSATKGPNCSNPGESMPMDWLWPFQLNNYELSATTSSHRLAWGANYGALGQTTVNAFGRTYSGYPKYEYAVFMVVGAHSSADVLARVTQMERLAAATVTGATWNPAFAGWEGAMASNAATVTLDPKGAAISSPVFHFTGFNGLKVTSVTVNGVAQDLTRTALVSVDAATQSVWLTLNGSVTAPITIQVH